MTVRGVTAYYGVVDSPAEGAALVAAVKRQARDEVAEVPRPMVTARVEVPATNAMGR